MKKLKSPILASKLRKETRSKAKINNNTRWSSTYEMIERYQALKDILPKHKDPVIDELLSEKKTNKAIDELCKSLDDLNSITKLLQSETILMCTVRTFSKARYALNDRRKSISPLNFESQLFLHANSSLWSVIDLNELQLFILFHK